MRLQKDILILIVIILGVFIYRSIILLNSSLTFFSDDAVYAILARSCLEESCRYLLHPFWPPLYPFLSYLSFLIFQNWEISLRMVSAIAGTLTLIPLFILVKKTLSLKTAVLFILTVSFLDPILYYSIFPLSDTLSSFFIISSIVTVLFAISLNKQYLFYLGGFLTGMIYLTRSEGTMFLALYSIDLSIIFLWRIVFQQYSPKIFLSLIAFIIIFFLTTSPYLLAIKHQLGYWAISQKFSAQIQQGHAFAIKNNTTWAQEIWSPTNPNYQSVYFKEGNAYLLDHLDILLKQLNQKIYRWQQILLDNFPLWSIIIMLIGIISTLKTKYTQSFVFLIFVFTSGILITIFSTSVYDIRYLLWTIPLFLYFFYLGITQILKMFPKVPMQFLIPFILSLTFPILSMQSLYPLSYAQKFTNKHNVEQLRQVGEWIQKNTTSQNPKIMTQYEGLEFYSHGQTIYLPQIPQDRLLEYAKNNKVDYFVTSDDIINGNIVVYRLK